MLPDRVRNTVDHAEVARVVETRKIHQAAAADRAIHEREARLHVLRKTWRADRGHEIEQVLMNLSHLLEEQEGAPRRIEGPSSRRDRSRSDEGREEQQHVATRLRGELGILLLRYEAIVPSYLHDDGRSRRHVLLARISKCSEKRETLLVIGGDGRRLGRELRSSRSRSS